MNASRPTAARRQARYAKILLVMEPDPGYHGGVLSGLSAYAQMGRRWAFTICSPAYSDVRLAIDHQKPDGVVLNVLDPVWAKDLAARRIPAVNVGHGVLADLPRVGIDDPHVGRLAARYLLDRGFTSFGFFGNQQLLYAHERSVGFANALARHGLKCSVCQAFDQGPAKANERHWRQWVLSLRKPAAIFAASDFFGMIIGEVCREAGVRVPEDVALLGVDNNELLCRLAHPPLSSINTPAVQIGFSAGRLLARLMRGGRAPLRPVLIRSPGIVTRQSSDILAVADADLADAIRYIRNNAHRPLGVKEILREVAVSRRGLERRFRDLLHRTPLEEIRRVHVEKAKDLLARTELQMGQVAQQSGFMSASDLAKIFSRTTGQTPSAYRRRFRLAR
jgi:LacI family transcriptional regulator